MARRLTPVLVAAIALAGCGGDEKQDAEQTVREFVKATNARDVNELCDDVLSTRFIEASTGATGGRATRACKQQLKLFRGLRLRLVRISETEVDGDKATVTTVIETQDRPQPRVFRLTKEGGDWRLAGGTGG